MYPRIRRRLQPLSISVLVSLAFLQAVCSNIEGNLASMLAMGDKVRWAQTELKLPEEVLAADESK